MSDDTQPVIRATPWVWRNPEDMPPRKPLPVQWAGDIKFDPDADEFGGLFAAYEGLKVDKETQHIDIMWGGYEYSIPFDRIDTPGKLIGWLYHIGGKGWEGTTPAGALALIDLCARQFDWPRWAP